MVLAVTPPVSVAVACTVRREVAHVPLVAGVTGGAGEIGRRQRPVAAALVGAVVERGAGRHVVDQEVERFGTIVVAEQRADIERDRGVAGLPTASRTARLARPATASTVMLSTDFARRS